MELNGTKSNADVAAENSALANQAGQECLVAALDYRNRGWSPLGLCPPDHWGVGETHSGKCARGSWGKSPWGPWKNFQVEHPSESELRSKWEANPQLNVGMTLGPVCGMIGIDVDGPGGEKLLQEMSDGDLPATLEFRRGPGRRLLYRIPEGENFRTTPYKGNGKHEEVRFLAKGAQTVMPPSRHQSGERYQWVEGHAPDQIEAAIAPGWLVKRMRERSAGSNATAARSSNESLFNLKSNDSVLKRAVAYLEKCPPAIAGQDGHGSCMSAARAIVYGFDLGPVVGYELLTQHYNPICQPPWSEEELRHKCEEADQVPFEKPRGYLLNGRSHESHPAETCAAKRIVNEQVKGAIKDEPQASVPPWPDPPAPEAYHGLMGDIVRAFEPHSEADLIALLAQTHIALGNLFGRTAFFTAENDRHFTNEFGVLVGQSSKARKGTSWGQIKRL
ncbi:MAG: bifunctional DNA primase/polymerase [Gemmataceae bacterium]